MTARYVGFTFGFAVGLATAARMEPCWGHGATFYHPAHWGGYCAHGCCVSGVPARRRGAGGRQSAAYNESGLRVRPFRCQAALAVLHSISLFTVLCLFWLLLSGFFTPFLLGAGVGSALAVVWLSRRMGLIDGEGHPVQLVLRATLYWLWLLKEIVKSAWLVSKLIIDPRLPISPTLVRFKPLQRSDVGLVIHANSITLTPGTIAIEAGADEFLVHGITRESAQGVIDSEMDRRVAALEGKALPDSR